VSGSNEIFQGERKRDGVAVDDAGDVMATSLFERAERMRDRHELQMELERFMK
jgi:hypothetical protein